MAGRYDPESVGVPSSGDPEADAREIRAHIRSRALQDEGLCPNGCGPLADGQPVTLTASVPGAHCPVCGFSTNVPLPGN